MMHKREYKRENMGYLGATSLPFPPSTRPLKRICQTIAMKMKSISQSIILNQRPRQAETAESAFTGEIY